MRNTAWTLVVLALGLQPCAGQGTAQSPPAFEVASVRMRQDDGGYSTLRIPPSGLVAISNASLRLIIVQAFGLDPFTERFTLLGGSERILNARFDIQARASDTAVPGQQHLMLRALLAERFGLRIHTETRPVPVYALTLDGTGRPGPQLRRSGHDCDSIIVARKTNSSLELPRDVDGRPLCENAYEYEPGVRTIRDAGPAGSIVKRVQAYLDRPLVDETGLTGNFEWVVSFAFGANSAESGAPSVFTAFKEQLGLKLEPRNAPLQVLVIDSVELPSPN